MQHSLTVSVALDHTAYHFDKLYDYAVPQSLCQGAQPGVRVLVPFGKGNVRRQGVILYVNPTPNGQKLKEVSALLDEKNQVHVAMDLTSLARQHIFYQILHEKVL